MVCVGGLTYTIDPTATIGRRISQLELAGKPLDAPGGRLGQCQSAAG